MKKLILVSALGLILSGCGGGSDSSSDNISRTPTAAQGTIDSVSGNTISVNGHKYDVASVSYAAVPLSASQLQPGMLVALSAGQTRSAGNHVQLEPTITGTVSAIDHSAGTFTVNGIELTFANLSQDIGPGDWVMVSSLPTATAGYKVLSVVKFDNNGLLNKFEVEGTVSNLTSSQFRLGAALTVDYTNANVENGPLNNGLWVEVEGEAIGSTISATSVEVESYDDINNDTEIEGLVTWVNTEKSSFELNYRGRFNVTNQTRFDDGSKANLVQGAMVEVTTGNNNLALEIEFDNDDGTGDWQNNEKELIGIPSDFTDSSFKINGSTIYVNRYTEFDDGLSFATLDGKQLEVEVSVVSGQYIAGEIELADFD